MPSLRHLQALGPFPATAPPRKEADIAQLMGHPGADPALPLDQVAAYSGLAGKTLKSDVATGKLVATRRSADGTVRVRLSDLHRYLDQQRRDYGAVTTKPERARNWGL